MARKRSQGSGRICAARSRTALYRSSARIGSAPLCEKTGRRPHQVPEAVQSNGWWPQRCAGCCALQALLWAFVSVVVPCGRRSLRDAHLFSLGRSVGLTCLSRAAHGACLNANLGGEVPALNPPLRPSNHVSPLGTMWSSSRRRVPRWRRCKCVDEVAAYIAR